MGNTFKRMILTDDINERKLMLLELNIHQKSVFLNILRQMQNLPVALRLLDAPLHEFLPREEDLISEIEGIMSRPGSDIQLGHEKELELRRVRELKESNPMLGHRGVRVGISYPEIYESQINAICEAAAELKHNGVARTSSDLGSSGKYDTRIESHQRHLRKCKESSGIEVQT